MANGDTVERLAAFEHIKLIDAVTATTSGQWVDVGEYVAADIEVNLATSATVQVFGSSAAAKPANATDGTQIGSNITTDSFTALAALPRWLKIKVTAVSGALSVLGVFRRGS